MAWLFSAHGGTPVPVPSPASPLSHPEGPRIDRRKLHSLDAILVIALCPGVAGANDFQDIALFGQKRVAWLSRFLDLPYGVPSHDTFERAFARLDPAAFGRCFTAWMQDWHHRLTGKHLAIDGKAIRGSASPSQGWRCLHVVNVWACEANLCLGMVACDADSNEVPAIPRLPELLELTGALATLDAGGCQKQVAEQIVAQGGDYLVVVKANQEPLLDQIEACLARATAADVQGSVNSYHEKRDRGHGREESRGVTGIEGPAGIGERATRPQLAVIGMCVSERRAGDGQRPFHARYFIGSKRAKARYYGTKLRDHWHVENGLHWRLDVVFREDDTRVHQRNAQLKLALVRRLALNLRKQEAASKLSVAKKRFAASLDTDFLDKILEIKKLEEV